MFTILIDIPYKTMVELTEINNPDKAYDKTSDSFPTLMRALLESSVSLRTITTQNGVNAVLTRSEDWEKMKNLVEEARKNNII